MLEIIIATIFSTIIFLYIYFTRIEKVSWKYLIRKNKNKLPNVDNGYWEICGPAGQKLRFTDDAIKTAHKRYLDQEEDGLELEDSKFKLIIK